MQIFELSLPFQLIAKINLKDIITYIYVARFDKCKVQYVRSTSNSFEVWFRNYKSDMLIIRSKKSCELAIHFFLLLRTCKFFSDSMFLFFSNLRLKMFLSCSLLPYILVAKINYIMTLGTRSLLVYTLVFLWLKANSIFSIFFCEKIVFYHCYCSCYYYYYIIIIIIIIIVVVVVVVDNFISVSNCFYIFLRFDPHCSSYKEVYSSQVFLELTPQRGFR